MSGPILRAPVLRIAANRWFRGLATGTGLGRRVASRFVAGESLDRAIEVARELDRSGIATILDHLGENVVAPEHAAEAAKAYVRALVRIREANDVDCAVSIKLSQLGVDFSSELCTAHVERVLEAAAGTLVMVDMESHAYV
ncbi:MAG: proline dehydrogenase, partial [Actinobacteria bacterium]|nr:proline dehydrogenase [Actinomycetota bacterium]